MTKVTDLIQKIRTDLKLTQAKLASEAGMDQSRLSRIEKGDVNSETDILDLLKALKNLGSIEAEKYLAFSKFEWTSLQPVSFSNPHRETLSHIDGVLRSVNSFLDNPNYPWPLKKQVENYKSRIMDSAGYLARTEHNIAVIGDIGTGKSTAISYLFDLLKASPKGNSITDNPILETGAGGTTICEVHIKSGPEFGLTINPMPQADLEALVSDFSSAKWNAINNKSTNGKTESVGVSREVDRAIRNMSKLVRKKTKVDGKFSYEDPTHQLVNESTSEEDFRTKVLALMNLHERDKNELWYDSSTRQNPMEWIADTFKKINNGRISECPLPSRINLLIPNFNSLANDLSLTVIDTKGVDDLAVREDLDNRLKDPRTAVVFCCRFNDAPGTSAKALLHHMRETISDKIDEGKVLVLALPRDGEAIAMKDDLGDLAETPEEGYEFKKMQLESEFAADDMENIAVEFLNVGSDDSSDVRTRIVAQVALLRDSVSKRALESCDAALDIISNHEDHALNFAVEAVSKKLEHFIQGTPNLSTRENHAHKQLLDSVESTRYASTLWAATRRNGIYSGLNSLHLIGIGASKDTKKRSGLWLSNLDSFLSALECDEDLKIASKTITSIRNKALECQQEFVERSRSIAIETYKEPLSHSHVWYDCANEWGQGPGFKTRVVKHLSEWFNMQNELQENLEKSIQSSFSELVKKPLLALSAHS